MEYILHNYSQSELAYKEFLRPSLQQAVDLLNIQENFQILDAGCGPGSMFTYFADKLKSAGHITGIDASDKHLEVANQGVQTNSFEKKVSLKKVDLFKDLPFADDYFDNIWLSDVLFPDDFGNQIFSTLKKLYKILKPSGKIAVFYGNWLRLTLLPGHSILEHNISIANEKRKSTEFIWKPEVHPENAFEWLNSICPKTIQIVPAKG
jgi:ubiquinone/menaquinone biosynthesis C-methylase UbiE